MTGVPEQLGAALADRYHLERELGAGGMATVFLAEDLKHERKVALKVLRSDLAAALGAERFHREIHIAAQLQHPNILPLLDSGEAGGFLYYTMPFVEGHSLRERLAHEGALPVADAVRILRDVADALTEAHTHGVVHRDIKPENIMLRGRHALVMDFGVAKAISEATGRQTLTTAGVALGTPAYMAPEQATADPLLDHRVDIYALGAVGYELLTGRPVFMGTTPQMVLSAHVTEAPVPVSKHRETVPRALEALVMRCLEKKPADRPQSAEELLPQLEALLTPSGGITPTDTRPVEGKKAPPSRRAVVTMAAGAVVLLLAAVVASRLLPRAPRPFTLSRSALLSTEGGLAIHPEISPDGKLVAYAAGTSMRMRVYIRPVSGGRRIAVSDDSASVETHPRWSPDGSTLLFLKQRGVSVASALGGNERSVVPPSATSGVTAATWSPDGAEIAFVRGDSLQAVRVGGGQPRLVWAGVHDAHSCAWSPDGKWIACAVGNSAATFPGRSFGNIAPSALVLFPAQGGAPIELLGQQAYAQSPIWAPDGRRLLFVSNRDGPRDIYALSLSASGRPRGEPVRLTTGLGAPSIALSADGTLLAYAVYAARANIWSVPIPATGPVPAAGATQLTSGRQVIESMRVSRDGRWLVYDSDLHGNADVYRLPLAGGQPEQLTDDPLDEFAPDLSPDGRMVAYHTFRLGTRNIEVKPLDGGPVQQVTATPAANSYPVWFPDGAAILFVDQDGLCVIYLVRRDSNGRWGTPQPVKPEGCLPDLSPDGRTIVYRSSILGDEPRRLFVMAASGGAARLVYEPTAATASLERALWSLDGRTLYFKTHDDEDRASLWRVSPAGGRPQLLVRFDDPNWQSYRSDFAVDARRFYFTVEDRQSDVFVARLSP